MSPLAQPPHAAARANRGASLTPAAKLHPPRRPPCFVARPRLEEKLDRASTGRVTLVSAHAGTGKTVLLSSWIDNARRGCVGQSRPGGQLESVASGPRSSSRSAVPTHSGRRWPTASRAPPSAGRIASASRVEDDAGRARARRRARARESVVLRELQALLDRAPPRLHVILSTRADPPLRLQRLRLAGELSEIRAADLAFTAANAVSSSARPTTASPTTTSRRFAPGPKAGRPGSGWRRSRSPTSPTRPGALRRFAGDDRAVADYLLNEVLARQSEQRREFLLRTSVPDRLSVELAERLTRRRDAGRMLAELEAANLLVSSNRRGDPVPLPRPAARVPPGAAAPDQAGRPCAACTG